MDKKYELIETVYRGYYRIKALKDFQLITGEMVKKGDLGGRIHGEHTLSQEGNCWISYHTAVSDNSRVEDNAVMKDFSCACGNSKVSGNAVLQAYQHIRYGTVTTDLLGTKDWIGALYAELGVVPNDNKVVLYKKVWRTDDESVFKSDYDRNFLYKIGETVVAKYVDEDIFKFCARGLHFTSLEFINRHKGSIILECEVDVPDIITVQGEEVRARKCRVIRVYKSV